MTYATVGTITQSPQGNVIKVSYKGTESEYVVDPTTPIFANAPGDRSRALLARCRAFARRSPNRA
jgi:hypothetical protein